MPPEVTTHSSPHEVQFGAVDTIRLEKERLNVEAYQQIYVFVYLVWGSRTVLY